MIYKRTVYILVFYHFYYALRVVDEVTIWFIINVFFVFDYILHIT